MMKSSLLGINAPRSRREHAATVPAANISLHIHRVVLEGFPRAHGGDLRQALNGELRAALAQSARSLGASGPRMAAGRTSLTHSLKPEARTAEISQAITKALIGSIQSSQSGGTATHGAKADRSSLNASLRNGKAR
jgi:hypothetical protein